MSRKSNIRVYKPLYTALCFYCFSIFFAFVLAYSLMWAVCLFLCNFCINSLTSRLNIFFYQFLFLSSNFWIITNPGLFKVKSWFRLFWPQIVNQIWTADHTGLAYDYKFSKSCLLPLLLGQRQISLELSCIEGCRGFCFVSPFSEMNLGSPDFQGGDVSYASPMNKLWALFPSITAHELEKIKANIFSDLTNTHEGKRFSLDFCPHVYFVINSYYFTILLHACYILSIISSCLYGRSSLET